MFETASNWEVINNYTEVTYPSGRMRVRNSTSGSRTIGVKKDFITGTGEHTVSFDVTLPIFSCIGGIVMGASSTDSLGSGFNASDTIAGVENYQTLSYPSDFYAVVEIRDENNSIVLKDSTNITATHSYTFSAPQGKEYNISLYSNRFCPSSSFHIDNVFISYDTLEVVTGNTIIVSDTLFIINNDFENPVIEPNGAGVKIDGWTHYSPSTTLSVEPHNGSDWLKVVSTNGTHGAHQAFAVEPGESYTFEIDLHRPAGMNKEINIVIWKNTGPSGAYTLHVLNTDGSNTFNYTATSSNIYIQIRQAGTYYLDNIRMYRTYEDTVFVGRFDVDMAYRYGYNTQERVDEIAGKGNHYTAPYWEYDPRVVHRWNRDPMAFKYPWQSPYVINNNNPIFYTDPYGLEGEEPEETGPRGAEQEDGSFNGYLDLPEVTVSAESRDKTEAQVKEKLRVIQGLSNPDWGDRYRRSLTAFKLAHKHVGRYGYSSYDFTRDYRKFGWSKYDPMNVRESYSGQWQSEYNRATIERNANRPQILPDAITISIGGTATAGTGTSISTNYTFILFGEDARLKPYITLTQAFGVSGVSAGGGFSFSGLYKSNGVITKYDLITPFDDIHGNNILQYFGREVSGNISILQGSYTYTPLLEGGFINSYSLGGTFNVGTKTLGGASMMSTFSIPINF